MIDMEERVNHLDKALAELAHAQVRTEIAMKQSFLHMNQMIAEMKADTRRFEESIQEDTRVMKERMQEDTRQMKEDTRQMKQEIKEHDQRIEESLRRMEEDTRRMKQAWGDLANKMGTVAEDVVAPNIPRLAVEEFGLSEVEDLQARARRTSRRGERRWAEYDVVCAGPGKVIVVEVKSSPTLEKIQAVPERLAAFFDFFPEYEGRELIGVFASWSIDEKLLPAISAAGLYGIAMGDDTMDVVAWPAGK